MRAFLAQFRYFDLPIFSSSILLLLLGLLMIYSTTLDSPTNMMWRQALFALIGLVILFALAFFDYRNIKRMTPWLYLIMIAALVFVWFFGTNVRGSTRWIDLGFFRLQPSEFAKLITIVVTAKFLDQIGEKIKDFRYVLLSIVYIAIPVVLILIEPDLGSSLVVFFTWAAMMLFSRMNKKHFVWLTAAFLILSVAGWFFVIEDYQKERVHTFLNPGHDPQGMGYNVLQSIIAVGSGQYWGMGVGRGLQSQLKFLPERQTDFIFASTAEELGLIGSSIILASFFVLLFRIIRTIRQSRDNFGMYIGLGIFFMLLFQVIINIGMNIGIMPVTGIPLPLVSLGGSSLITTLAAIGLVESIVARQKALRFD